MSTVTFTPDQEMAILSWLEDAKEAGLTLDEIIEGMEDGTLTTIVSQPQQDINVH